MDASIVHNKIIPFRKEAGLIVQRMDRGTSRYIDQFKKIMIMSSRILLKEGLDNQLLGDAEKLVCF